jgi:hypothetical protein
MTKLKLLSIMLIAFLLLSSFASGYVLKNKQEKLVKTNEKNWNEIFGGTEIDQCFSIIEVNDGFVTVGWTYSYGAGKSDVWLIKTDLSGNKLWDKTFGGSQNDRGFSVKKTNDNGYVIVGYTESFGKGFFDLWLIKTDKDGNEQFNKTFGGGDYDFGLAVQQTKDEGFIITGKTASFGPFNDNAWLIKTDKDGNKVWDKVYGGRYCESGFSLLELDEGYILAGYTESFGPGNYDSWIIRTDLLGEIVWNKTYGGEDLDVSRSIQKTSDGCFIIAGWAESFGPGKEDVWLFKINENGEVLWEKTFGKELDDAAYSAYETVDGGFIVAGYKSSWAKLSDFYMIKTDKDGNKEWDKTYGGTLNDQAYHVLQTKDNGFILCGWTKSFGEGKEDIWLVKTDEDGNSKDISKTIFHSVLYCILKDAVEASSVFISLLLNSFNLIASNSISFLLNISDNPGI